MIVHDETRPADDRRNDGSIAEMTARSPATSEREQVAANRVEVLADLICVRMLATGMPGRSTILKQLEPFFADRPDWNASAWRVQWEAAIEAAMADGRIGTKPFQLTDRGRDAAASFLGLDAIPKYQWTTLKNRCLVARSLGIKPPADRLERLGKATGLYAAILVRHYGLSLEAVPTEAAALDGLAWQQLAQKHEGDFPTSKKFTRNAVLTHVFFDGVATKNPASRLASMVTDAAPRTERIRNALISRWLEQMEKDALKPDPVLKSTAVVREPADALEIGEFANRIRDLAVGTEHGRFGPHKVFINQVWHLYRDDNRAAKMDRKTFDEYLLEAGRRGLLTLNRADLVEAMNPIDVRESEIRRSDGLATFHLVRTDP